MIATLQTAFLRIYEVGGPVVVVLGAISVLTLSVVLYKTWHLATARVGRHSALRDAVAAWDAGDRAQAHVHLNASESYLAEVLSQAMGGQSDAARLEAEAETRFARLESGFRLLDSVAQMSPLLGLFGTVLGMISAFQALQGAGTQVDPSVLAGGIWVALLTTAVGLAVAMPTSLVLSWFEARMDRERIFAERAVHTILSPKARIDA